MSNTASPPHIVGWFDWHIGCVPPPHSSEKSSLVRVVVERGGVPERERGVRDIIQSHRFRHVLRAEQQPIAGTRAAEQLGPRIARDVVTTVRRVLAGFAGALTPSTDARELAGIGVHENVRVADHRRLLRMRERHLDHVDAEAGRVGRGRIGYAPGLLFSRSIPDVPDT